MFISAARSIAASSTSSLRMMASRSMATKSVEIPVALHGIEGRYATALYSAAAKTNALEKVESELEAISQIVSKDAKLKEFLNTPLVARSNKKEGVAALLSGGKYSDVTKNFFQLLAENGRLDQTLKIISSYAQLMTAYRKEVQVTVTSAAALDSKTLNKIRDSLSAGTLVAKGSKILLENKVDPSIIGGFVVEIGDKTIDLSVSSKVTKLNKMLTVPV